MPCFSSRSIITDPIRIAIPNAIQPSADRKSLRKVARSSAADVSLKGLFGLDMVRA